MMIICRCLLRINAVGHNIIVAYKINRKDWHMEPLISIIVPIYSVEQYV